MTAKDGQSARRVRVWSAITLALATLCAPMAAETAFSQGFKWPWEIDDDPPPRRPANQPPPYSQPDPYVQPGQGNTGGWTTRSSICRDLERRLVQESAAGGQKRNRLPELNSQIRKLQTAVNKAESRLDRAGCYEEFLFTRTLRRAPKCVRIARERDKDRRQLAQLEGERQEITARSNHSYQDEIIRGLARNNCGANYVREARRRDRSSFSPFWEDQDGGSGYANPYKSLPFATYRTLCVRLCDGYYFPVSFSTLPNHFQRDADICPSRCAAPTSLYYHQNPGAGVEQMVSYSSRAPYTDLKEAFLYRKKYVDGCSCKQAEYVPQTPIPGEPAPPAGARAQADPALSPYR